MGFASLPSLTAWPGFSNRRVRLSFCVTPSLKRFEVVLEFQPVVHRLRLSASA